MTKAILTEVKLANPGWFSEENKRFFNDHSYSVHYGADDRPFLVRHTSAWTDMFDGKLKPHYRVNPIHPETLKILPLVEEVFLTLKDVKEWLKTA